VTGVAPDGGACYASHVVSSDIPREESFSFTGSGSEYFRIWIVNLMLSVITLGIYSAWAKVRRLEYFYRNTRVAGASFDYHGRPLAILKGRIVAALLFGGYTVAGAISPVAGLLVFVALAGVMPFLINRSLRFRLYNSSYRGIRFQFHGSTGQAYWVFLALPILSAFTLMAFGPFWHHQLKEYQHTNAAYGRTRFSFNAPISSFYKAYLVTLLCLVAFIVYIIVFAGSIVVLTAGDDSGVNVFMALFLLSYLVFLMATWSLTTALIQNLVWRHTTLGPHRFLSTLEVHRLMKVVIVNALLTVITLGLFKPFAQVRLAKYMVGELAIAVHGSLDQFAAGGQTSVAAVGEEAAEIFDIDLAF
jgi:uncharacterized membrane protein YjgN (DUF898 family)